MNNLRFAFTHYGAMYHWGLRHGQAFEGWTPGIRLRSEWSYFDCPEYGLLNRRSCLSPSAPIIQNQDA